MKKLYILLFLIFILPVNAETKIGDIISGSVWVIDGDSLRITDKQMRKYEIRLFGINAPELSTNSGEDSKWFLIRFIKSVGRTATCKVIDIDKYKRYVSICKTDKGDLSEIMLKNKQARLLKRYLHLAPLETQQRYKKASE